MTREELNRIEERANTPTTATAAMRELLTKHPTPWKKTILRREYDIVDVLYDANGVQVLWTDLVSAVNAAGGDKRPSSGSTADSTDHRIIDAVSVGLKGIIGDSDDVKRLRELLYSTGGSDQREHTLAEAAVAFIRWAQDLKLERDAARAAVNATGTGDDVLNLLARIFRDGGQKADTYPTLTEAIHAADDEVCKWLSEIESTAAENDELRSALAAAREQNKKLERSNEILRCNCKSCVYARDELAAAREQIKELSETVEAQTKWQENAVKTFEAAALAPSQPTPTPCKHEALDMDGCCKDCGVDHRGSQSQPTPTTQRSNMTDEQIKHMVDRFLCWKLPKDFNPDCGISVKKFENPAIRPVGTNLFSATQATAMVRHMIEGLPSQPTPDAGEKPDARVIKTMSEHKAFMDRRTKQNDHD